VSNLGQYMKRAFVTYRSPVMKVVKCTRVRVVWPNASVRSDETGLRLGVASLE
jgi:hypothetical protein